MQNPWSTPVSSIIIMGFELWLSPSSLPLTAISWSRVWSATQWSLYCQQVASLTTYEARTYILTKIEKELGDSELVIRILMFHPPYILIPAVFRNLLHLIFCHVSIFHCQCFFGMRKYTESYKACQMPIRLVRNFVVTSAASSGIFATNSTNHFSTDFGVSQIRPFAIELALRGKSGIRIRALNFLPLGDWAMCVTVGKSRIPAEILRDDEELRRRWMISRSMYDPTEWPIRIILV